MNTIALSFESRFVRFCLLLLWLAFLSGCAAPRKMIETPDLYRDNTTPLFGSLAPELAGNRLQVLYTTDRLPLKDESGRIIGYGAERSTSGALGIAEVEIENEDARQDPDFRPPIKMLSVDERVRFPETPHLYTVGEHGRINIDPDVAAELEQADARARREITNRLALTPRKDVYLDVHGVATEFEDTVLSMAEFWHFLGREGVPLVYTWPAGAKGLVFYTVDRESGEFTVLHLKQFIRLLADMPEIERIHITAHSRGNDIVLTALRELIIEARAGGLDPRERLKIANLVLVAADMDMEVDMQRMVGEAIGPAIGRVTVYSNSKDKALGAAKSLFGSQQRLGTLTVSDLTERQQQFLRRMTNLDLIVYEGSGGGFLGHSYYDDPAVSSDVLKVLRYGWRPGEGKRQGLERVEGNIWRITDNPQARK